MARYARKVLSASASLQTFFEQALDSFQGLDRSNTQNLDLGPLSLKIHSGHRLHSRDFLGPLASRPGESTKAQAEIYCWDGGEAGSSFPAPPWGKEYVYTYRGDVKGFGDDRLRVAYSWDARVISLWDEERKIGLYWTPSLDTLPSYEWAAPLRTLLHWIGLNHGLQLTHAAAVGLRGQGLLLAGKGGSGKSTTSLACWSQGWEFVSDDYCWVSSTPKPQAHAVYRTAKLLPDQNTDLPQWPRLESMSQEKSVFHLEQLGGSLPARLDLQALVLSKPSELSSPLLGPAEQRDALAGLSLSTVAQLPGAGAQSMAILRELSASLRCYHLELCHPVSAIPRCLEQVFRE